MKTDNRFDNVLFILNKDFEQDPRAQREAFALSEHGYLVDIISPQRVVKDYSCNINFINIPIDRKRSSRVRYLVEFSLYILVCFCVVPFLQLRKRYCVVQVFVMPEILILTCVLPKLFGAKILLDWMDPSYEVYLSKYRTKKIDPILILIRLFEILASKISDYIIIPNKGFGKAFRSRNIDTSNMDIVFNSADELYFTKRHDGHHVKDNDCFKVLYHGSMFLYNGPQIVVDAFKEVLQKVPNIKLIMLGDGPCLENIRKDVEQNNLGKHIIFEGRVPIDKLQDYIHEADIGVIPSLETPFTKINLPTRIMELIAMCKPVICSNLPGVQDYFNEEALLFFEPSNCSQLADHIINLYYYPQKSSVMTNKASESLDLIKWRETKKVYLKVISRLANNERLSC